MKKLFMIFICSFFLNSVAFAQSWEATAARIAKSIVRVETKDRICTGFSINKTQGNILTAHHCLEDDTSAVVPFTINGKPSYVVQGYPEWDLAVIWSVDRIPGLTPRLKPIRQGLPIAAMGFAYTLPTLTLTQGVIAAPRASFAFHTPWLLASFHYISGMSGGPVFDREGRIVSVVQKADDQTGIGLGRPLAEIMQLTRKYWN